MGERKLFQLKNKAVTEIASSTAALERQIQRLFEENLEALLGIRFLASEYDTGLDHAGRIDTLGIDENGCPVIIEYKRHTNENILSQVLFYFDWLVRYKAEFELAVLKKYGEKTATQIDWSGIRLLCIAGDYAKYDLHAVPHIGRNIELITYRHYGDDLLLLDYITGLQPSKNQKSVVIGAESNGTSSTSDSNAIAYRLSRLDEKARSLYESVRDRLAAMGEDVQIAELRQYIAFKRIKNFACLEVFPTSSKVTVFLKINPETVEIEPGFTRDVRNIGHFGTGDLEVSILTDSDLARAVPLFERAYGAA